MKKAMTGILLASLSLTSLPAVAQEGAIVGALIGAVVGNQVGNGSGRDAATAVGAVVGAAVGAKAEREREGRRGGNEPNPPRYDDRRDNNPPPRYGDGRRDPAPPPRYDRGNPRRPNPPPVRPNPPRNPGRDPYPPSYPPRNPNLPPGNGSYSDSAFVPSVTRRTGGEWIHVTLDRPVSIDTMYIQPEIHGLRIHEAYLYNQYGQRLEIRSFWGLPTIYPGQYAYSERLFSYGRVQSFDIRVESMGGYANAWIRIQSPEGPSYPRVSR